MFITPSFRFHFGYLILTILLFIIEVFIGSYVTGWVRGYMGDVLVVILIYSAIMTVVNLNKRWVLLGTLIFAFIVEFSQHFKLAELLNLQRGSLAYIVIGNTFSVADLICYSAGCLLILVVEYGIDSYKNKRHSY